MDSIYVLLFRRWSIRPWTHDENARLRDLKSIGVCTVGLGQSRVMQWRASVSAALLLLLGASGGFCSHIVGGVAVHLEERERERFENPGGNTLTAWISLRRQSHLLLMNERIVGEAESAPHPHPSFTARQSFIGRRAAIRQ